MYLERRHMPELTILNGLAGGLVATGLMTVFMLTLGDDAPPPTAMFWSQYVGDGPADEYMPQGLVLHFLYGIIAGVVFVLLVPLTGIGIGSLSTAVLLGLAYGFVMFAGAAVFWMNVVLDLDPELPAVAMFLLFHLVYGGVLGVWVGIGPL
jgi:hypothetical protein